MIGTDGGGGSGLGGDVGGGLEGFSGSSKRKGVMGNSGSEEINTEKLGLEISIEEMRYRLKSQYEGVDAIKATARTVFGASSLIVSLLAALQLSNVRVDPTFSAAYSIGVVLAMALYAFQITLCISVLLPVSLNGPVKEDWDILYESFTGWNELLQDFTGKSEIEILRKRLSAYLNAIELNEPIISDSRRTATWASYILPVIVIILLLLSLIPRVASPS